MKLPVIADMPKTDAWLRDAFEAEKLFPSQWLNAFGSATLSMHIMEENTSWHIYVQAPGIVKNEFTIGIENKILTITVAAALNKDYNNLLPRSFYLPENIDEEMVAASYVNGMLTIYIPKPASIIKKEVPVQ